MTNKRFIEFMTQNSDDGKLNHGFKDMVREEWYHTKDEKTAKKCVDLLNEQEELIKRLKTIREEQTETILKQKRKMQELEERNKRQYNRLKELTELMYERQWGKLENIVEEWEKQDELLQKEWHNYEDL